MRSTYDRETKVIEGKERTLLVPGTYQSMEKHYSLEGVFLGDRSSILTIVLMVVLGVGGSTLGMGEEFIPLIPVFMIVSKRPGFDRIYGMALVIVATEVGFAASTPSPFTVYVAQGIAELPLAGGRCSDC